MTETAPALPELPTGFVHIRFKETGSIGSCPVDAVDLWKGKGYEVVDESEVEEAVAANTPFDPTAKGNTAKVVNDYLTALDTSTPEGKAEYDRVVAAEQAGENRSTALPS